MGNYSIALIEVAAQEYLHSCESLCIDGNTVKMANNTMNKVVGVGTVRFHLHDGRILN